MIGMEEKKENVVFNYATLLGEPFAKSNDTPKEIYKNIFDQLRSEEFPDDKKVIDRYKKRKNEPKRELVIIRNRILNRNQITGVLALIKNNIPKTWDGKDIIKELVNDKGDVYIEPMRFMIDFSNENEVIVMHEFNYEGPRLSDLVFYLRSIAKDYSYGKKIDSNIHLDIEFEDLERKITNIFHVGVKVRNTLTDNAKWLQKFREISELTGYKDCRMDFFFQRNKRNGDYKKNVRGLGYVRQILNWVKKKENIEKISDFKLTYTDEDHPEPIDFDFIKNKTTSTLIRPETEKKWLDQIINEFNLYITEGKTNCAEN